MSTPPRRRRPDSRRSPSSGGSGWLPTIAMGLGVIVAGLGIGALVAVLMGRNTAKAPPVAVATSAPSALPAPTRPPVAIATFEPPRTPRPSPSALPSATPAPTVEPTPPPRPSPVPTATATLRPAPPPTQAAVVATVPTAEPPATAVPAATAAPPAVAATVYPAATSVPAATAASPLPAATSQPAAGSVAPASSAATSAYDEHATAVVRRYIGALIRGDEKTAYSALGENSGSASGALTEQSFLDPTARIVSMKVARIDASNASVGCEITSAKGRYYATYHITAGNSGPYISQHDYIKV